MAMSNQRSEGRSPYTRSGPRRLGDDYQDIVALDLAVEILEHPERYEWMMVEADGFGSLDDVVAKKRDGGFVLKQVKFSTNPDSPTDPWQWENLLEPQKNNGKPLLRKWTDSLKRVCEDGTVEDACVVTNRRASAELAGALDDSGRIAIDHIVESKLRDRILETVESDNAEALLSQIRFEFDSPGLDVLGDGVKKRFRQLGGTDEGWTCLKEDIRLWVIHRNKPSPGGRIELQHIRVAAQWNRPEPLPQDFVVPDDYVLPSEGFHTRFKGTVLDENQTCVVLTASPGCGKSTYLSYLFHELEEEASPVVRHHFFLSVEDPTVGRLDFIQVANSLMADLQRQCHDALGNLATRSPEPVDLSSWLDTCGSHYQEQGKKLVLILDGLDHVWRENENNNVLNQLFEHVVIPRPGVTVVLGTQPVDDYQLPSQLIPHAPRGDWLQLPILDYLGVARWVEKNAANLGLSDEQGKRDLRTEPYSEAFHEISHGHPLHLKYSLHALLESGGPIDENGIRALPTCPHSDITAYYGKLWRVLPDAAREILHLLAEGEFPWPFDALPRCLDPSQSRQSEVMGGLRNVKHLLRETGMGWIAFHSSLLTFVAAHDEHQGYAKAALEKTLVWLKSDAPEFWRWAYEWLTEAKLGNTANLLQGPNREWIVESIAKRRPWLHIKKILTDAAWISLEQGRLPLFVRHAFLYKYAESAHEYLDKIYETLLPAQLKISEDSYLSRRLHGEIVHLSDVELHTLGESAHSGQQHVVVKHCLQEIRLWVIKRRDRGYVSGDDEWPSGVQALLKTAVYLNDPDVPAKVLQFVQKSQGRKQRSTLQQFTRTLRAHRSLSPLRNLLILAPKELQPVVARDLILLAIEKGVSLSSSELDTLRQCAPEMAIVFAVSRDDILSKISGVTYPDLGMIEADDAMTHRLRATYSEVFESFFWSTVGDSLSSEQRPTIGGMATQLSIGWIRGFFFQLADKAHQFAEALQARQALPFSWLFASMESFEKPSGRDAIHLSDQEVAARRALEAISLDCFAVSKSMSSEAEIVDGDMAKLRHCPLFEQWTWLDSYIDNNRLYLAADAFEHLVDELQQEVPSSIDGCCNRAENLGRLAALSAFHGDHDHAKASLRDAARDLIGYGWRKDILFFDVLDVTELCAKAKCGSPEDWVRQIAPAIAGINDFTDGRETDHLPVRLARLLPQVSSELSCSYYLWLAREEEEEYAIDAFQEILRHLDLSSPLSKAIALTAIDNASLSLLSRKAKDGDKHAASVLAGISESFGDVSSAATDIGTSRSPNNLHDSQNDSLPNPDEYPPDHFLDYVDAVRSQGGYNPDLGLGEWFTFWNDRDSGEAAVTAVEQAYEQGHRVGRLWHVYELVRELRGREEAYPWFVKSAIFDHVWDQNWARHEEVRRYWEIVRRDYPSQDLDFLYQSLKRTHQMALHELYMHGRTPRIVEYLIYMGKTKEAEDVAAALVDFAVDTVKTLPLPLPEWAEK